MESVDDIAKRIVGLAGDCPTPMHWHETKRWLSVKIAAALAAERERAGRNPQAERSTPAEDMDALHDQATRIIEKIRHNYRTFGQQWSINDEPMIRLRCAIATAIDNAVRAERAKFAAFADENKRLREALAEVQTASRKFWEFIQGEYGVRLSTEDRHDHNVTRFFESLDSTRTAAEAAKEKVKP